MVLSTIIVGNKNQTVAPVFYIDGYSENGYTEEAAAQSIYENYQKNIEETTRMNDNELIHKLSRFSNVKNTMEQNTPGFFNIAEKLYPYMDKDDFDTSLYVLSNKDRTFGVSVLLYDNTDILKDCLNKVKD